MIAIVGAGVAGLATALGLSMAGRDVVVIDGNQEPGRTPRDLGRLHINPAGQVAFAELGVGGVVSKSGFPVAAIDLRDNDGASIGRFPSGGSDYRYTTRAELVSLLLAEVGSRGVQVHSGHSVSSCRTTAAGARLEFASGSEDEFELVIGADGPLSTVRGAITPDSRPPYAGQIFVHGETPNSDVNSEAGVVHVVRDAVSNHAFGWATQQATTHWWLRITTDPAESTLFDETGVDLREALRGYVPSSSPGAELIRHAAEPIACYAPYASRPGQQWVTPGVALVGDAVHACSPAASWSAALAAEDAVALSAALRDHTNDEAIRLYQQIRRARAERAIAAGNPRAGLTVGPPYDFPWGTSVTAGVAERLHHAYAPGAC